MPDVVLLDAGPLGLVSHPRPEGSVATWLQIVVLALMANRRQRTDDENGNFPDKPEPLEEGRGNPYPQTEPVCKKGQVRGVAKSAIQAGSLIAPLLAIAGDAVTLDRRGWDAGLIPTFVVGCGTMLVALYRYKTALSRRAGASNLAVATTFLLVAAGAFIATRAAVRLTTPPPRRPVFQARELRTDARGPSRPVDGHGDRPGVGGDKFPSGACPEDAWLAVVV